MKPTRAQAPASKTFKKPGNTGGRLIREVIAFLRSQKLELPLTGKASHILIATSGGSDSLALAHLLVNHGTKVTGGKSKVKLLHINHGWRGKESDRDEQLVRECAKEWGVKIQVERLKPPPNDTQESWEALARQARKRIYAQAAARKQLVLTAHHADDLAETLLWRLFTGAAKTHGGGIAVRTKNEIRPLLRTRKSELRRYLEEEGQVWREDATNHEDRFLRARLRSQLLPVVEKLFPKAIEHLVRAAFDAQSNEMRGEGPAGRTSSALGPDLLFAASGLKPRRVHLELLHRRSRQVDWVGELHLPGGWKLLREKGSGQVKDRWVLERI